APAEAYSSSDHAADLAGLMTELRLSRPAVAGHSMGAGTTLRLVAEQPELVRCAILADPGFRSDTSAESRPNPGDAIRRVVQEGRQDGREATMERGRAANPTWDESEFGP